MHVLKLRNASCVKDILHKHCTVLYDTVMACHSSVAPLHILCAGLHFNAENQQCYPV